MSPVKPITVKPGLAKSAPPRPAPVEKSFWNVDLIEVSREWLSQLGTLFFTALAFVAISLPVVISGLVLWYLAGFPPIF